MKNKVKTKSKETVAPNPVYAPFINDAADRLKPAFETATVNNAALMPRVNQSLDYFGDAVGGKYLSGNPHLQSIIDATNRGVETGVSSQFSRAGRYGSGNHAGVLARALAENEGRLRYGDYAAERGIQDNAARALPGVVGVASDLPQRAASTYAQQIAALLGRYATSDGQSTQTQKQGAGGLLAGALGAGLSGWASGGFG